MGIRKIIHESAKLLYIVILTISVAEAKVVDADQSKNTDEEIERIKVVGQQGDAALRAFNSGDFVLAEVKFLENAKCAKRKERNRQAFIDGVQNAAVDTEVSGRGGGESSITDSNASRVEGNNLISQGTKKSLRNGKDLLQVTCDNRGFQIYMAGMSQLQLGRADDAEASFEQAITISQNQYDAHHRLALIKLLRGDKTATKGHLESIRSMLKRCYNCDAKSEILLRINFLEKALAGEVRLN